MSPRWVLAAISRVRRLWRRPYYVKPLVLNENDRRIQEARQWLDEQLLSSRRRAGGGS